MKNFALFSIQKLISVTISQPLMSLINLTLKVKKNSKFNYLSLSILFVFILTNHSLKAQTWGGQQGLAGWWLDPSANNPGNSVHPSVNNNPFFNAGVVASMPSVMSGGGGVTFQALNSPGEQFTYYQLSNVNSCSPAAAQASNEYLTATATIRSDIRPLRISNMSFSIFQGDGLIARNMQLSFAARDITANGPLIFANTGFDAVYANNTSTVFNLNSNTTSWNFITLLPGHTYEFRWYLNSRPSECGIAGSTTKRIDNPTINVQMMDPVSISGTVFNDNNGITGGPNGTAVNGTTITLFASNGTTVIATTTTNASGNYTFTAPSANYIVAITPPTGFQNVSSTDATSADGRTAVTLGAANVTGINFGINQPPVAVNDALANQPSGIPATIFNLLSNDTDPNNGTLSPGNVSLTAPGGATSIITTSGNVTGFTVPGQGVWNYNPATGGLTFTQQAGFTANPTPVNYTVKDAAGLTSNSAQASITFAAPSADVSVIKTASNMTPVVGSTITFTIKVANAGPNNATSVSMTDLLPNGYNFVSAANPSAGTYANNTGIWTIGNLANGANATLAITATVNASGTYTNTARVSSPTPDPNLANNTSTVTPCVAPTAPIAGTVTQPSCSVPTGSVTLNGLPPTGNWTVTRAPGGTPKTGTGTTTTTITGLAAGSYTFTVTNGACTSAPSATIIINPPPVTPTAPTATVTQPSCSVATGSIVLNGLPATGTWTVTQSNGTTSSTIIGTGPNTIITGLAAGNYTFKVTNAATCTSPLSTSITINAQPPTPTAPTIGTITQPTSSVSTGSVVLNGLPTSGNWTITQNNGTTTSTISGRGPSTIITGLAAGVYTFTVSNGAACTSPASASVTINTPVSAQCPGNLQKERITPTTNFYDFNGAGINTNITFSSITPSTGGLGWTASGAGVFYTMSGASEFDEDNANQTLSRPITNANLGGNGAMVAITIRPSKGITAFGNGPSVPATLQIIYNGVTYATFQTAFNTTTNVAVTTANGATSSNAVIPGVLTPVPGQGFTTVTFMLPANIPNNGTFSLQFNANGGNTPGDDYSISAISFKSCPANISGNVFNDNNGTTGGVNGTAIGGAGSPAGQLYVNLVNTSGNVEASTAVAPDGSYSIPASASGAYTVQLSTVQGTAGSIAPAPVLPSGWFPVSETDGSPNLSNAITVANTSNANITGTNFGINQPPVATNDVLAGQPSGVAATIPDLLNNDSDPNGDTLLPSNVSLTALSGATNIINTSGNITGFNVPGQGAWDYNFTTGALTFTPQPGFTGNPTPIEYTVKDAAGLNSNNAQASITYAAPDPLPVATDDLDYFNGNNPKTIAVLANDNTGDAVVPTTVSIVDGSNPDAQNEFLTKVVPDEGTWTVNPTTGAITFTPLPAFKSDPTPITYTVKDAQGNVSNPASITLKIPGIRLTKTGVFVDANGNGKAEAGETISYTFKVENTSDVTISDMLITDPKVTVTGGPITLAPGASDANTFTATYTLTQADLDAGQVNNLATATGKDPKGNPVTDDSENGNPVDPDHPAPPTCTDCTVTPVPTSPALRLTKTGTFRDASGDGKAQVGETVTYTFKVENTGNVTVSDIILTDPKVSVTGGPITLAPGANDATTFTATYTLSQADLDAGQVNNLATATGKDPKGNPVTDDSENGNPVDPDHPAPPTCTDCTVTPVPTSPALRLTKTGTFRDANGDGKAQVGETIAYTFRVENTGNVTVNDITITDPKVTVTGGPVTLAPGASDASTFTATYTLTQADLDAGQVNNLATATGKDPKGNPVTDTSENGNPIDPNHPAPPTCTDCTVTPVPISPALRLTKTGTFRDTNGDGKAQVGETIAYTFRVENTGNVTVNDITITDPKVTVTGGPITLAPGASDATTFTATYTLTQADLDAGQVNNLATATGKDPKGNPVTDTSENGNPVDPNHPAPPTCTDCTVTPVPQTGSIRLTKTGSFKDTNGDGKAQVGETVTYTFKVENTGNVTISDIKITDPKVSVSGGPIALAPGASDATTFTATYTLTQADLDAGQVNNLATATGKDPKGNPVTDTSENGNPVDPNHPAPPTCTDCTVTPVPQTGAIALVKQVTNTGTGANGAFLLGNTIEYTFTIKNTGNVTLNNLVITDLKISTTPFNIAGSLLPGASTSIKKTYVITAADIAARNVTNSAVVTATDPKGNPVTDKSGSTVDNDDPTVTSVSKPPVANNDQAATKQNQDVIISILTNDVAGDSPINPASVVIVTNPTHGTLILNPDGTVTYKPALNYYGPDGFVYTVKDLNGQTSNPATVTIDVIPSKPVAIDDVAKTSFNTPVDINILLNDKEDGSPFQKNSIEIIDQPLHGTIRLNVDGTVTYTPFPSYTGTDTFTYRVKDLNGNWTNMATVTISVEGFFIPNVFTPNGDGKNDTFFIVGLESFDSVNIEIYNRWGGQVYKMNGYKNDWTGDGLNEGTYFYKVVLKKGASNQTVSGPVLIKR